MTLAPNLIPDRVFVNKKKDIDKSCENFIGDLTDVSFQRNLLVLKIAL